MNFNYELSTTYTVFMSTMLSDTLISEIATALNISTTDITILNITSGSTLVTGYVSTNGTQADANRLTSTLQSSTLPSFTVLSSSVTVLNQSNILTPNCTVTNSCPSPSPQPSPQPNSPDG